MEFIKQQTSLGGGHIAQLIQLKNTKHIPLMWIKH